MNWRNVYCPECNRVVGAVMSDEPMPSVYHLGCLERVDDESPGHLS